MAALAFGGQAAIAASAQNLTTLLGLSAKAYAQRITVKNAAGAGAIVYLGNSDVTNVPANAHIELSAGQSYDFYSSQGWQANTDEIYAVGTVGAANIVFINGMA